MTEGFPFVFMKQTAAFCVVYSVLNLLSCDKRKIFLNSNDERNLSFFKFYLGRFGRYRVSGVTRVGNVDYVRDRRNFEADEVYDFSNGIPMEDLLNYLSFLLLSDAIRRFDFSRRKYRDVFLHKVFISDPSLFNRSFVLTGYGTSLREIRNSVLGKSKGKKSSKPVIVMHRADYTRAWCKRFISRGDANFRRAAQINRSSHAIACFIPRNDGGDDSVICWLIDSGREGPRRCTRKNLLDELVQSLFCLERIYNFEFVI